MPPATRCSQLYERAIGYWDFHHENHAPARIPIWDQNRSWSWHTFDRRCPIDDLLSAAAGPPESAPSWFPAGGLKVLFVGDSLDKHLMQGFCKLEDSSSKHPVSQKKKTPMRNLEELAEPLKKKKKEAKKKKKKKIQWFVHKESGMGVCKNAALQLSNYRIFGLGRPSQQRLLPKYENRQPMPLTWDTHYRLETLLFQDLGAAAAASLDAIVLHSGVWDLSRPKTDVDPVTLAVAAEYHAAVRNISKLMRRRFPRAKIFWRTGPPVGYRDGPLRNASISSCGPRGAHGQLQRASRRG